MYNCKNRIKKKLIFILLAVSWIIITIYKVPYIIMTFDDCTSVTEGIIIDTKSSEINGSTVYYPIYQINIGGEKYTHVSIYPENRKSWITGEKVVIKYNKRNPKEMYSQEEIETHKSGKIEVIIGLLILLIAVAFIGKLAIRIPK